ncbi:MAG: hypothetical protein ACU84Q_01295 [Gammaproteobacteria bacterium]
MTHSINRVEAKDVCEIVHTGEVSAEDAIEILDEVWRDDTYQDSPFFLWDVARCEAFPDFNQFMAIADHARSDKPANGSTHITFYSSAYASSMLAHAAGIH